jgi:hypothetical protein
MVTFQIPLPGLARDFNSLTPEENDFIHYFSSIDHNCIAPVVDCYAGIGPNFLCSCVILKNLLCIKSLKTKRFRVRF